MNTHALCYYFQNDIVFNLDSVESKTVNRVVNTGIEPDSLSREACETCDYTQYKLMWQYRCGIKQIPAKMVPKSSAIGLWFEVWGHGHDFAIGLVCIGLRLVYRSGAVDVAGTYM